MRFNVVSIEPQGFHCGHFLDDGLRFTVYGLESLGHDVTLSINKLSTDRINIIVGARLTRPEDVQAIANAGPYIAIQSEVITETGLNDWHNQTHVEEVYLPFLMGALAVWDAKPKCLEQLRMMGIPAYLQPVGYHPRFEDIPLKAEKDIDFLFFGSVTPHRRVLFEEFARRGYRVEVLFDTRKFFRDDMIARTKVHLAPCQNERLNQLSLQRVCYLVNNKSLCVVEECPDQGFLENCFLSAATDQWIDLCITTLQREDREELAQHHYENYREIRLEDGMRRLLDETFKGGAGAAPTPHFLSVEQQRASQPGQASVE